MSSSEIPERAVPAPVYGGIFLCSLAVLMQEILLTRIFSFTIWYHLAYLTISTALIGFGAAGSILTIFPDLCRSAPRRVAGRCAAAAGITLLISMFILAPRPISPATMLTQPGTFFIGLLGYYIAVTVPFLFAGLAVAAPLAAYPHRVNRLYAADLLGAGLGCLAAVLALIVFDGAMAITICAAIFIAGGALYMGAGKTGGLLTAGAVALLAVSPLAARFLDFVPTDTKQGGKALRVPGAERLFTQWSPIDRVDLYRPADPDSGWLTQTSGWWTHIGMSPKYTGKKPELLTIMKDASSVTDVYRYRGPHSLDMLGTHLLRTPYVLKQKPRVLVIGVGGGIDVMNALWQGASHVTGVDLQPITNALLLGMLSDWTGGVFHRPDVELVASDGRHYVRSHDDRYDVLQITFVDSYSAQTTGAYVLSESYMYTVEAFQDYLSHLNDDGVVSIIYCDIARADTPPPPPHQTRLALTAREALRRSRAGDPQAHIMLVAWHNYGPSPEAAGAMYHTYVADLLVKRSPFTPDEVQRMRKFTDDNGLLLLLAPGGVEESTLSRLMDAPDAKLPRLLRELPLALNPVTDDNPFFFHFLRWPDVIFGALRGEKTVWCWPGSLTSQLMLLMMLGQALLVGGALIILPLARQGLGRLPRSTTIAFLTYFLGLGLGFLMIEISFMQKYMLVLGNPTYSLSVTICSLLVSAAVGAALCRRGWGRPQRFLGVLLAATIGLVVLEGAAMPVLRESLLAAPFPMRIGVTAAMQFPLGVALGMYFPTGLELLRRIEPRLIPWAWAINGVASVVATVLAVILAMEIGFSNVALVAVAAYAVGTLALLAALRGSGESVPSPS